MSFSAFAVESPTSKIFQPAQNFFNSQRSLRGVVLQCPWVRSVYAIKLTETALRTHGDRNETLANARRLYAANHIKYNGNDVVDCFILNFI